LVMLIDVFAQPQDGHIVRPLPLGRVH
jgi:hypothetical protein